MPIVLMGDTTEAQEKLAKNLDKQTCQGKGHTSGVVGLIYIVGNITLEGEALSEAVGGSHPPFIKVDKWDVIDFDTGHMPFVSQPGATIVGLSIKFSAS
ncbi:hypothetical protein FHL15_004863 [Xylaria flabelliformis]|uniref:Uncharacterized protein n=1 Tax=Xylaria flabelliformis TaxID=2512241 RepID=A0A553I1K5_9PEZI|nr:hypothetical protein FHL15_004863 [Xylaria flabelliformis]